MSCGPESWKRWFRVPKSFFIETSCKKHDDGYAESGTWLRKIECDVKFYGAMLSDCQNVRWQFPAFLYVTFIFLTVLLLGWPIWYGWFKK